MGEILALVTVETQNSRHGFVLRLENTEKMGGTADALMTSGTSAELADVDSEILSA